MTDERDYLEEVLAYFLREIVPVIRREPGSYIIFNADDGVSSQQEEGYLYALEGVGLMKVVTMDPGFAVTELGKAACLRPDLAKDALGLLPATPATPQFQFNGPVGAVATGSHGTAVGTVNVNSAMHQLVDLQDQLGELSDDMWKILRRLREVELNHEGIEGIRETVEDLDVERLVGKLRGKKLEQVSELLQTAAPAIVQVLSGLTR